VRAVRANIAFGPIARGAKKRDAMTTADRFVQMMGLERFAGSYPHQVSRGMKQRVAIARVLANDADLALMDEPFGALDAMTRERLQDELLSIWRTTGLSIIVVTHSLEEAIFLADRVVVSDVASPAFNEMRRHLASLLHGGHVREAA
jgi:NitT/TauT family transport system ATP-binding protein